MLWLILYKERIRVKVMALYTEMTKSQLTALLDELKAQYKEAAAKGLKLDMSRGKPGADQLALSMDMLETIGASTLLKAENGLDCRNYGGLEGIPEARGLMAQILDVEPDEVFIGGTSSLNLMHDCMSIAFIHGLPDSKEPWRKLEKVKILCPSPGYDRHFKVSQHFGFEMIAVPMTPDGPDMPVVEELVADPAVKGMWCVPKYANPTGCTYSEDTVRRIAQLKPAAPDFCIFYDNAYAVHDLYPDSPDTLLPLMTELKRTGSTNMAILFSSTAKITFPGGGISAIGASKEMIAHILKHMDYQTICYDKINQLRHVQYLKDINGVKAHMAKHAALIRPKFEVVRTALEAHLGGTGIASWSSPKGGYFLSLDVPEGCARKVVALCKEAGVVMTPAGATYPHGNDPADSNIRIAPTFPTLEELKAAAELLCLCVKLASVEKLLS